MASVYLESSYLNDDSAVWLKGNLHTHTTRSDGKQPPQEVVAHYAGLGHDFLMLSDHDTWGEPENLDACGMVLLTGAEICGGKPHVLCVGGRGMARAREDHQGLLNDIARRGGMAILCHPNWEEHFNHYPFETLASLKKYAGIEVFNGVVIDLAGSHMSTDKWDRLLSRGMKVWGFANDDAHRIAQAGRGWNVVRAKARTSDAIVEALRAGSFYMSSGVTIESIATDGPLLKVRTKDADQIAVFGNLGARLGIFDGPELTFDVSEVSSPYVRVECYGRGDRTAWTQPLFVRNGKYDVLQKRLAELGAGSKSKLKAHHARGTIRMTGAMSDAAWTAAKPHRRFMCLPTGDPPPVATEVRAVVAGGTLYIGVKCEEPQLDAMKLTARKDGDPALWTNDSIEIFLDFERKGMSAHHIVVNADGFVSAFALGAKPEKPKVRGKSGRWQEGDKRGWSVEVAVPLEQFGFKPGKGKKIGLHICRNRFPKPSGTYMWSWVGGSNHNRHLYGTLEF